MKKNKKNQVLLPATRCAKNRKIAFTLAEVLITLGIIGAVAALTIPTLIQNHQEKVTVTKVKKFFNIMSQSYDFSVQKYGLPSQWGITTRSAEDSILLRDKITGSLKVIKLCDTNGDGKNCGASDKYNEGTCDYSNYSSAFLADGTTVIFVSNSKGLSIDSKTTVSVGEVQIDINGLEAPNVLGKDVFMFYVTDKGIIPSGTDDDTYLPFSSNCLKNNNGLACTAWLIYNENMDYLHCPDELSWHGKHKCSD